MVKLCDLKICFGISVDVCSEETSAISSKLLNKCRGITKMIDFYYYLFESTMELSYLKPPVDQQKWFEILGGFKFSRVRLQRHTETSPRPRTWPKFKIQDSTVNISGKLRIPQANCNNSIIVCNNLYSEA